MGAAPRRAGRSVLSPWPSSLAASPLKRPPRSRVRGSAHDRRRRRARRRRRDRGAAPAWRRGRRHPRPRPRLADGVPRRRRRRRRPVTSIAVFNIGGGELLVILLLALIVLGPQRLPDAARQIGKVMGEVRRMSSGFQQEMKAALRRADDRLQAGRAGAPAPRRRSRRMSSRAADRRGHVDPPTAPPANGSTPKPAPTKKAAARKRAAPLRAPAKGKPASRASPRRRRVPDGDRGDQRERRGR